MILRTERLIVRPWQRADLERMAAWPRFPDPLDAVWNWPHLLQAHGTADLFFLTRAHDPCRQEWTITTQAGQVIGHLGIRAIQQAERQAQLGIGLGYPFLQQGYGTEALRAFLHAFFGAMGFQTLRLEVAAYNSRARRVYHRLGFREVGVVWQRIGPTSDFGFLSGPAYAAVRPLFRQDGAAMLALSSEMTLTALDWQRRQP
ncbi:MAG: GNAT family N-acetyltransferase [Chloroflexota bacterium]|nr:GNAT family N-acetyltransferase [Chloroflexota bacterium]